MVEDTYTRSGCAVILKYCEVADGRRLPSLKRRMARWSILGSKDRHTLEGGVVLPTYGGVMQW